MLILVSIFVLTMGAAVGLAAVRAQDEVRSPANRRLDDLEQMRALSRTQRTHARRPHGGGPGLDPTSSGVR